MGDTVMLRLTLIGLFLCHYSSPVRGCSSSQTGVINSQLNVHVEGSLIPDYYENYYDQDYQQHQRYNWVNGSHPCHDPHDCDDCTITGYDCDTDLDLFGCLCLLTDRARPHLGGKCIRGPVPFRRPFEP